MWYTCKMNIRTSTSTSIYSHTSSGWGVSTKGRCWAALLPGRCGPGVALLTGSHSETLVKSRNRAFLMPYHTWQGKNVLGHLYISLPQISFMQEQKKSNMHPPPVFFPGVCGKEEKHLLLSEFMTFLLTLGRKEPLLSLPVREVLTLGVSDGQEAPSGLTLFSRRTCTLADQYPGLVCWDPLPCPLLGSPLSFSSEPCHFLSLERQRWGAGSQGLQRSRGSTSGVSLCRRWRRFLILRGRKQEQSRASLCSQQHSAFHCHLLADGGFHVLCFPLVQKPGGLVLVASPGALPGTVAVSSCPGGQHRIHPHRLPSPPLKTYFCRERQDNLATENSWDGSQRRLMASLTSPVYL